MDSLLKNTCSQNIPFSTMAFYWSLSIRLVGQSILSRRQPQCLVSEGQHFMSVTCYFAAEISPVILISLNESMNTIKVLISDCDINGIFTTSSFIMVSLLFLSATHCDI